MHACMHACICLSVHAYHLTCVDVFLCSLPKTEERRLPPTKTTPSPLLITPEEANSSPGVRTPDIRV